MDEAKYCKWYCVEWVDDNKWMFQSRCGETRIVSRYEKFFKELYDESDYHKCPNCGKPTTVGALMD
jgi:hypothetical protein